MEDLILLPDFERYQEALIVYLTEKLIPQIYGDEKSFRKFQGALQLLRSVIVFPSTVTKKYGDRNISKLLKKVEERIILRSTMALEKEK